MCFDNGIRKRKVEMASMCAQYDATTSAVLGFRLSATQAPIGSQVEETPFSPASTRNEVTVMVMIRTRMKLPSSWDLPLSFSGVNTTLRSNAAMQPTKAMV